MTGEQSKPFQNGPQVEGYLRGDRELFEELESWIRQALNRYYPGLAREHEDLVQVVHGKLLGSLRQGRYVSGESLRAYVTGVVHHAAIDRLREIYRRRTLDEALSLETAPTWSDPYRSPEGTDKTRLLHQALLAVPASCRELWLLLLVERLTYEDIGRRLAIPAGTVKSRMWSCRRKALEALRRLRLRQSSGAERQRSRRAGHDPQG